MGAVQALLTPDFRGIPALNRSGKPVFSGPRGRGRAKSQMGDAFGRAVTRRNQRTAMKSVLKFAAAAIAAAFAFAAPQATAESVQRAAAVVNGTVISTYDLDQRVRMILSTSGGAQGAAAQQRLREQVLRTLIDEILQLLEAQDAELVITEAEVDEAIDRIAQQNNTSREAIVKSLAANGIGEETLRVQIRAELAWSQLIEARLAPRVNISEEEIDQEMRRIEAGATKPQFLASEIFIAVDSPADEARARRTIEQIYQQLNSGSPFVTLAEQFSESATASRGGDLGWVQDGDVPLEIWQTLQSMRRMSISRRVRPGGGYYIIALRDKMRPAGSAAEAPPPPPGRPAGVPAGSIKLKRGVIGLPPQMSKAEEERVIQAVSGLREQIKGCQGLEEFAGQLQGVAVVDLPVLPIADLAPEVRQVIQGLNPSDVSPPYFSREGDVNLVNMLVVCGDRPRVDYVATRAFEMPTREEVGNRMFNQELSVMARRYMRDLRRDASIEIRDAAILNAASN